MAFRLNIVVRDAKDGAAAVIEVRWTNGPDHVISRVPMVRAIAARATARGSGRCWADREAEGSGAGGNPRSK